MENKLINALKFFKEELQDGKCSDDCLQCNAYEVAIMAIENMMARELNQNAREETHGKD